MTAFVLSKKETFRYLVKVRQARDSGKLEEFEFTAEFRRLDQAKVRELLAKGLADRKLLDEVWVGWSGVKTLVSRDGVEVEEEMPVTPTNREALLLEPGVEIALARAWLDAVVIGPAKN
jgi:hypothetical protein